MIELESVVQPSPIGLRVWDVAIDGIAEDGLAVACRPAGRPAVVARRCAAGAYALWGLPAGVTRRIEVADPDGRYLPLAVDLTGPGLDAPACTLPGLVGALVPLFSTPSRPVPAGLARLLVDLEWSAGPAPWALVRVDAPGGGHGWGVADGAGRAAVLFPYPEPSTVAGSVSALSQQAWPVTLAVSFGTGSPRTPVARPDGVPELCALLSQLPTDPIAGAQLRYGRDLVVRTPGRSTLVLSGTP